MQCMDIINLLDKKAPREYALEWDHVGLLVGRRDREVHKLLLVLDVTESVIDEAISKGVDMIVSHHPMIFGKVDRVNDETVLGRKILKLIEHGICCYAMHTNFDTIGGMAKEAAMMLGLQSVEVLDETKDGEGIGEIGYLPASMEVRDLVALVKEKFDLKNVIFYGNTDDTVEKVAICPGSGKSVIDIAVKKGATCLITGDIGHHEGLDANEMGLSILDASHYGLEHIFMHMMYQYLQDYCMDVEIETAEVGVPFSVL